jgi:hypothetical protein
MSTVWDKRIEKAEKYMEKYLEHGKKVYCMYEDNREDVMYRGKKVNFFYANVNTMKESLFNSLPKPDVSRLHRGDFQDDVSRVAASIMQRCLTYEVHCAPDFKEAVTNAILENLVPGMGAVWLGFENGEITCDHVFWEDYIFGPARKWSAVPWVGRKTHLTKTEVVEKYGEEALRKLEQDVGMSTTEEIKQILRDTFCVYEIWDKKTKKVFHIAKGASEPLLEMEDPLKLKKFFPCPKPLVSNLNTKKFLPVTDYYMAQDQYDTLNTLYQRINLIVKAIKVAGLYDSSNTAVASLLTAEDNKMVPVDNWAMFAERGGTKGLIDWYPVEVIAQVLQHLQGQVEVEKALLYEITGMSDIMRGASNQYETAKAQQIKAQFAGVRIAAKQRDVGEFVGEVLSIMAEMATQLYDDQKLQQIVGDLPPEDMQYVPYAVQILRSDVLVKYKVSVQADSMTEADWQLEKEQRMEVVGAIGQILGTALPMLEQAPDLMPMVVHLVKFAVVGYKAGRELEGWLDGQLDKLLQKQLEAEKNPPEPKPSPEEQKAQAEIQKMEMEAGIKQQEAQAKAQAEQQKMAMEAQMMQQKLQFEREMAEIKLMLQQALAQMKLQESQMNMQVKQQEAAMDMTMQAEQHAMDKEMQTQQHEMDMENNKASAEQDLENKKKQAALKPKPKDGAK